MTVLLFAAVAAVILFHKPAMPDEKIDGRWLLFAAAVIILAVML